MARSLGVWGRQVQREWREQAVQAEQEAVQEQPEQEEKTCLRLPGDWL